MKLTDVCTARGGITFLPPHIFDRVCSDPVEGDFRESADNPMQKNDGGHIPNQIDFSVKNLVNGMSPVAI
jgi:hypothetical protein